jgi:predicted DCC family thiol-disulfide oxidoreductase YuxK
MVTGGDPAARAIVGRVGTDLVFYDGGCGLCHGFVKFLLARDRDGSLFRFAPLQGATFARTVPEDRRGTLPDSVVLRTPDGDLLIRTTAVVRALCRLAGAWRTVGRIVAVVPRPLADWAYDRVASIRKALFRRPPDACPVVPAELRARFLD